MDQPKYRAFISYSHRDAHWGAWLHRSLESYRPPKPLVGTVTLRGAVPKRLTPVFRDRDELASAIDLSTVVNEALEQSACQIVICSPSAAKSRWVNEEILAFKRLGRENRIFCVIVAGEPNATDMPNRADEECFPPALRFKVGADRELSSVRTEPVAADARPGKDGKTRAKLKLIAGILGLGYDALAQREHQRRNRRLVIIAAAATAGFVITSGLATFALIQRSVAQRQTARAEAEAETARQTTGFLIDLFKISDPSEARGNSVTAREMLDKGAARLDTELAGQPAVQATLLDTVGTVYMGLGLYKQARPLLDRALITREHRPGVEPAAIADSLTHRGELLMWQGDYAAAEADYRRVIALENQPPVTRNNVIALARAEYGLGMVLASEGKYAAARVSLEAALARQRLLFGEQNEETARSMKELADALDQLGERRAAIDLMERAVKIEKSIFTTPHPALKAAINNLGIFYYEDQRYTEAESMLFEALAHAKRLYGDRHVEVAASLNTVAFILSTRGDLAQSETLYLEALEMYRGLLGDVHADVAFTLGSLAFVLYEEGDKARALTALRQSLHIYRQLFPGDHPDVASSYSRLGLWLALSENFDEAERDLDLSLAMRQRLFGNAHPDVATSLVHLAILDVARGRFAQAEERSKRAREIYAATYSPEHWETAIAECVEGAALTGTGHYAEAEQLLTHGYAILSNDRSVGTDYRMLAKGYFDALRQAERRATPRHARAAAPSPGVAPEAPVRDVQRTSEQPPEN
jgi:tetratricopeptide (TPR) repeat protein